MSGSLEGFIARLPAPAGEGAALNCRVLLRRALVGQLFPGWADEEQSIRSAEALESALEATGRFDLLRLSGTDTLDRRAALERDLVPQSYAVRSGSLLAFDRDGPAWCTINETDHLRIRAEASGADLAEAYRRAGTIDEILGESLDYAFSPDAGYICAEIADWGTGLSASVTVHLPALAMAGLVDRALRTALDSGLSVHGFWSDESASSGALYELETPRGAWTDEESTLVRLGDAVERIAAYEKGAREELLAHDPETVRDAVFRAFGTARYARRVSYDEGAEILSRLRLGAWAGMISGLEGNKASSGFYGLRNAHLLKYLAGAGESVGDAPAPVRVEEIRARVLRSLVADADLVEVS